MLYNLFIATFSVLAIFSVEASIDQKAELKNYIYSSYEDNLRELKKNSLEYLAKDLDQFYEVGYEMVSVYWNFIESNPELMDHLENAKNAAFECVKVELNVAIDSYEDETKSMSLILKNTPKNPTCYKNLALYFEDMKHLFGLGGRDDDEHFEEVEVYSLDTENFLENLNGIITEIPDEMKNFLETTLDDYVQKMVDYVKSKTKKKVIRKESTDCVDLGKKKADEYVKDLREKGLLNQDGIMDIVKKYEEVQNTCQDLLNKTYTLLAQRINHTLKLIANIERYANATFYILDDENNKKQVDCKDDVPYLTSRSNEDTHSYSVDEKRTTIILTGYNNGRRYKRKFMSEDISHNVTIIAETIEYDDDIIDRTYLIEFADSEKT